MQCDNTLVPYGRVLSAAQAAEIAILAAAAVCGVDPQEVRGRSRRSGVVDARQIAMWVTRQLAPFASLSDIGMAIGAHHHTTVMHAIFKVQNARGILEEQRRATMSLVEKMATGRRAPQSLRSINDIETASYLVSACNHIVHDLRNVCRLLAKAMVYSSQRARGSEATDDAAEDDWDDPDADQTAGRALKVREPRPERGCPMCSAAGGACAYHRAMQEEPKYFRQEGNGLSSGCFIHGAGGTRFRLARSAS